MKKPGSRLAALTAGMVAAMVSTSTADARTIKIVTADSLELRNVDGQEIVVISGENLDLRVDDDVIKAKRVEFNRTERTLTLVGNASYYTAEDDRTTKGNDLVVDLSTQALTGQDVLMSDTNLEIRGKQFERVPGQMRAEGGYFTTCARCGQTTNDFAFRAERMILYPGDRMVAYKAQLLIADAPVMYLPVVVLPLNDKSRQPRAMMGQDARDGFTVEADLPFSIGHSTLGTSMLRYYGNRGSRIGGGVDMRTYSPTSFIDRADLYVTAIPKPNDSANKQREGYDVDLKFSVKGGLSTSQANRNISYTFTAERKDTGRNEDDPDRGVTKVDFRVKAEYPRFNTEFVYVDRFGGAEPKVAIREPYRKIEATIDPKAVSIGNLNADFKVTAGRYSAQVNSRSKSLRDKGPNITTTRLEEKHALSYVQPLWEKAEVKLENLFTGRYYGTGARTVDLSLAATLTQRWGENNTFTVSQGYRRIEGTSPFQFDALNIPKHNISAPLRLSVDTAPAQGATFRVSYVRDWFLPSDERGPLSISTSLNREPVQFSANLDYDSGGEQLESFTYDVTLGDPNADKVTFVPATKAVPATPTTKGEKARPAHYKRSSEWPVPKLTVGVSGGYQRANGLLPLNLKATVNGDVRSNYFTVTTRYSLIKRQPVERISTSFNAVATRDTVINPISVSGSQTLTLDNPETPKRSEANVSGSTSVNWRQYRLSESHSLNLERPADVDQKKGHGDVNFSVGTAEGKETNWEIGYGGHYDMDRMGFTAPELTASAKLTQPERSLSLAARVSMPGLDNEITELKEASMGGEWQSGRFALSGRAVYSRSRSTENNQTKLKETLSLTPLKVGVGLGSGPKPGAYVTAALKQDFVFVDGVRQEPAPLAPVLGLTIDRCCWVLQAEVDLVKQGFRLGIGLPGEMYPLYELTEKGPGVPLIPGLGNGKSKSRG